MTRKASVCTVALLAWALTSCAGQQQPATESLPLQESGLAVGGDVEANATKVVESAITPAQLEEIQKRCRDAEGIPLEGGDSCARVVEIGQRPCGPRDICVRIYAVEDSDFAAAGYVEVTDHRTAGSLCDSDPKAVCMRLGMTEQALKHFSTTESPSTESPTTESPTTESPTTESPTIGTTEPTATATSTQPSDVAPSATQ